jgi:hypothetical protein
VEFSFIKKPSVQQFPSRIASPVMPISQQTVAFRFEAPALLPKRKQITNLKMAQIIILQNLQSDNLQFQSIHQRIHIKFMAAICVCANSRIWN